MYTLDNLYTFLGTKVFLSCNNARTLKYILITSSTLITYISLWHNLLVIYCIFHCYSNKIKFFKYWIVEIMSKIFAKRSRSTINRIVKKSKRCGFFIARLSCWIHKRSKNNPHREYPIMSIQLRKKWWLILGISEYLLIYAT